MDDLDVDALMSDTPPAPPDVESEPMDITEPVAAPPPPPTLQKRTSSFPPAPTLGGGGETERRGRGAESSSARESSALVASSTTSSLSTKLSESKRNSSKALHAMAAGDGSEAIDALADILKQFLAKIDQGNVEQAVADINKIRIAITSLPQVADEEFGKLRALGYKIWNGAVMMSKKKQGQVGDFVPKARHVAADLIALTAVSGAKFDTLVALVNFYGRTGQAWKEFGNFALAESCLNMASDYLGQLNRLPPASLNDNVEKKRQMAVSTFSIHTWRAEVAWSVQQKAVAMASLNKAKEMIKSVGHEEIHHLSMLCYNFAIELYQTKTVVALEEASELCKLSYDVYSQDSNKDDMRQARTLRLLANAQLELKLLESALSAVNLSLTLTDHPAGHYLASKIHFMLNNATMGKSNLAHCLNHRDTSLPLGIEACEMAAAINAEGSIEGYLFLAERFRQDRAIGAVYVRMIRAMIHPSAVTWPLTTEQLKRGSDVAESVVKDHVGGSSKMDEASLREFQVILWEVGIKLREENMDAEAVAFFRRLVLIIPTNDYINRAKAFRMLGSTHLGMKCPAEAMVAAATACELDPKSPGWLLMLRVHMAFNSTREAIEDLNHLCSAPDFDTSYLTLCAQEAQKANNAEVCVAALEHLLKLPTMDGISSTVLRNLVRFTLTGTESNQALATEPLSKLVRYMRMSTDRIREHGQAGFFKQDQASQEAEWLAGVAWQQAYLFTDSPRVLNPGEHLMVAELFNASCEFYMMIEDRCTGTEQAVLGLMQSANFLMNYCRSEVSHQEKTEKLRAVVERCSIAKTRYMDLERVFTTTGRMMGDGLADFPTLVTLTEYEAKVMLGDPNLGLSVQQAISMPSATPSFLESMATMAMQHSKGSKDAGNFSVSVDALKGSLKLHLQAPTVDYAKCSAQIRMLVQLIMQQSDGNKRAIPFIQQAMSLMSGGAPWPQQEVLWLLVQTWNIGVKALNHADFQDAEQWMSTSIGFLRHFSNRGAYEADMMKHYTEVLERTSKKPAFTFSA